MPETVIIALVSLIGTALGAFSGMRLVVYRLQVLEKRVEEYNTIKDTVTKLEVRVGRIEADICELKPKTRQV